VQVGIHAGFEHGNATQFIELGGMRLVVKGAGDQHVKVGVACLAGGGDEVSTLDGAKLWPDEDSGALW